MEPGHTIVHAMNLKLLKYACFSANVGLCEISNVLTMSRQSCQPIEHDKKIYTHLANLELNEKVNDMFLINAT